MNQRGWGLSTLIGFLLLFGFFLVIVAILYNQNFSDINDNKEKIKEEESTEEIIDYTELENILEEGAKEYISSKKNKTDSMIITLNDIEIYLPKKLIDLKTGEECMGYAIYFKKQITPFIRCGSNYQTDNYDKTYED